jgi:hypothetical protein
MKQWTIQICVLRLTTCMKKWYAKHEFFPWCYFGAAFEIFNCHVGIWLQQICSHSFWWLVCDFDTILQSSMDHVWCLGLIMANSLKNMCNNKTLTKKFTMKMATPNWKLRIDKLYVTPTMVFFPLFFVISIFWHKKFGVAFFFVVKK